MPTIYIESYGKQQRRDGKSGWLEVIPTRFAYEEKDGSDVRLDRVYVFNGNGEEERRYLRDKMGMIFTDNDLNLENDPDYLMKLPSRFPHQLRT